MKWKNKSSRLNLCRGSQNWWLIDASEELSISICETITSKCHSSEYQTGRKYGGSLKFLEESWTLLSNISLHPRRHYGSMGAYTNRTIQLLACSMFRLLPLVWTSALFLQKGLFSKSSESLHGGSIHPKTKTSTPPSCACLTRLTVGTHLTFELQVSWPWFLRA